MEGSTSAGAAAGEGTPSGEASEGAVQAQQTNEAGEVQVTEKATPEKKTEPIKEKTIADTIEKEPEKKPEKDTEGEKTEGKEEKKDEAKEEKPVHKHHDRLSKAFPDRPFENDNDYDTALEEYLSDLESYKDRGVTANQKLINLFEASPEVAEVVRDMIAGATLREALARHISPEDLSPVEGDPDYEGWEKNKNDRVKKAEDRRKFEQEYSENLEFSSQAIKEFAKENDMTEEAASDFLGKFDNILADIYRGKIGKETLALIKRAMDYDSAVEKAKEDGKIVGRNEKIVVKKKEDKKEGDGLPKVTGSTLEDQEKEGKHFLEDMLDRINERKVL